MAFSQLGHHYFLALPAVGLIVFLRLTTKPMHEKRGVELSSRCAVCHEQEFVHENDRERSFRDRYKY